jgi:hypothetical protein
MFSRNVIDAGGRTWACRQDDARVIDQSTIKQGQDVSILCTTASVVVPIRLTVGWKWNTMADNGLARLITDASPVPKRV